MAVATLRLGRRSKELLTMTIDEVRSAQMEKVGSKNFLYYQSFEPKTLKMWPGSSCGFRKGRI